MSSSNEGSVTEIPAVVVTPPAMEAMSTFDDVDEDEAFICELMAMHPNDDDIVVEDLEEIGECEPLPGNEHDAPACDEATGDVRLAMCTRIYFYRSLLLNKSLSPGRAALSLVVSKFQFFLIFFCFTIFILY